MNYKKCFLLLLFYFGNVFSQEYHYLGDNKLIIQGSSNIIVDADMASFNFSVQGFGSSLLNAVIDAKNKVSLATKVLLNHNVKKKNISTSNFESGENFDGKAFLSSSKDYKTLMTVFVIVDSLSKLEDIIINLSEQGIQSISDISYSIKEIDKYKHQVKMAALEDAKIKAKQIADKLNIILKKIIYVEEGGFSHNYPNPFNPPSRMISEVLSTSFALYAKPVKISQTYRVVYSIE